MNIAVVLKAMGAESDQEVIQLVGEEAGYAALLMPTIQECKALGIFTQQQALEYLGGLCARLPACCEPACVPGWTAG